MALTADSRYLIVISSISSRMTAYDLFMIFDLKKNKWIYKKTISNFSKLIVTKDNDIGLCYFEGDYKIVHFRINEE